jgi:hypothetical protein
LKTIFEALANSRPVWNRGESPYYIIGLSGIVEL